MLLYNMNFRITPFGMTEPSPCVLFFPMYYLVSIQKTKANLQTFQFHNGTCTSITDVAKYYYIVCNMLNLNFCNCSFPLWKKCFCLNWYFLFVFFIQDTFSASGARTSNMDIVFRCSVYSFILLTNTISQMTADLYS